MTSIINFTDRDRGYVKLESTKAFVDDDGFGKALYVYRDDELCGMFKLDKIDSFHIREQ